MTRYTNYMNIAVARTEPSECALQINHIPIQLPLTRRFYINSEDNDNSIRIWLDALVNRRYTIDLQATNGAVNTGLIRQIAAGLARNVFCCEQVSVSVADLHETLAKRFGKVDGVSNPDLILTVLINTHGLGLPILNEISITFLELTNDTTHRRYMMAGYTIDKSGYDTLMRTDIVA